MFLWSPEEQVPSRLLKILVVVSALVAIPVVGFAIHSGVGTTNGGASVITPGVNFDGTQFTIQNQDAYDWTNVTISIQSTYDLTVATISAGQTYNFLATQFVAANGTQLNPAQVVTGTTMDITCTLPDGSTGTWSAVSP